MSLRATSRRISVWTAAHTSPIEPFPRGRSRRYLPAIEAPGVIGERAAYHLGGAAFRAIFAARCGEAGPERRARLNAGLPGSSASRRGPMNLGSSPARRGLAEKALDVLRPQNPGFVPVRPPARAGWRS